MSKKEYMHQWLKNDAVCYDMPNEEIIKQLANENEEFQERIKELEDCFDELIFFLEYIEANHEPRTSREWIDRLQALKGGK